MPEYFFQILFIIGFMIGVVIRVSCVSRVPHWWKKKQTLVQDKENALDKLIMLPVFLGMIVIPVLYLVTSWLDFLDYHLPKWASFVAGGFGVVFFALALWFLWRSHFDLGHNFSPELKIKENHTLVTSGVYAYIRHPMYAAHFLWAIGQALLLQNWIAGWAFLVAFFPVYLQRYHKEEKMLIDQFGEEYRAHMSQTGRLIPRFRK